MGRYTKTDRSTRTKENPMGDFWEWDNATSGDICHTATHASGIGRRLSVKDAAIFGELAPGEDRTIGRINYFRD